MYSILSHLRLCSQPARRGLPFPPCFLIYVSTFHGIWIALFAECTYVCIAAVEKGAKGWVTVIEDRTIRFRKIDGSTTAVMRGGYNPCLLGVIGRLVSRSGLP